MKYNEILCRAIDTIVTKRLDGIQRDITKKFQIKDDSDSSRGHYLIQNGLELLDAYSENTTLAKDDWVYVLIPQGNYNEKLIILLKDTQS